MKDTGTSSRATPVLTGALLGAAAVAAMFAAVAAISTDGFGSLRDIAIAVIAVIAVAIGIVVAVRSAPDMKRRGRHLLLTMQRHALPLIVLGLLTLWLLVYLACDIFIAIKPGQGGVLWKRFDGGTVTELVYGEGLHAIPPWDEMTIYDLRYQENSREFEVLSSDGLLYNVEVTVRFRLREQSLGLLHKCVGPHYIDTMLLPEVGAVTRMVAAQLRPDELYTSQRHASELAIRDRLRLEVGSCTPRQMQAAAALSDTVGGTHAAERYFEVSDVFIRRVVLPPKVAEAIEMKLVQRQKMLEYDARIERERKEAERKAIEADGIRTYNETVARGMSPNVLRWHEIQATLELAKSPNSKVVVMGSNDRTALPLIVGSPIPQDSASPSERAAAPPAH